MLTVMMLSVVASGLCCSARGSFAPWLVYSAADIRRVVEHARARGVRVIVELDVPGEELL